MSEVRKCKGEGCPIKEECFRFRTPAVTGKKQIYFETPPYNKKDKTCEFYSKWGGQ